VSDLSQELRLKVDEDLHRKVHAIAMAAGEDAASWIRHVVKDAVDAKVREHNLLARLLRCDVGAGE
jgi:hypothetical protein